MKTIYNTLHIGYNIKALSATSFSDIRFRRHKIKEWESLSPNPLSVWNQVNMFHSHQKRHRSVETN